MEGACDLIASYRQSLRSVLIGREAALGRIAENKGDFERLSEMESDLLYVLEWLTNEMEPGPRRGIERRSRDQRTVYLSEMQLEQAARRTTWHSAYPASARPLSAEGQARLDSAMRILSPREHRAFTLVCGHCFSAQETAELMGVRVTTVKTLILRARKKLAAYREEGG